MFVTDSKATPDVTGDNGRLDIGTPVGSPTPTGEPQTSDHSDQADLFPGARPCAAAPIVSRALLESIGCLVLAWGQLERTTLDKVTAMRRSFGDVRVVGGRTRPTMQKLLGELRALVAMRDRHDKQALAMIAEIDGALQRTGQFRQIIIDGAQDVTGETVECRDVKNGEIEISFEEITREAAQIERIRSQIALL